MIAWLAAVELPRMRPPSADPVIHELLGRIERQRLRATVLDATTDIDVPVRISVLESADDPPRELAVGMAAHLDPVQAHRKALMRNMAASLLRHETIWAAGGTPNALFSMPAADLVKMTGGRVIRVKE